MGTLTNEDVLRTAVPWTTFANAGIISRDQMELIYALDEHKASPSMQAGLFHEKGVAFVTLFADIITGINKDDVICYTLAMLDEITDADPKICSYFTKVVVESKGASDPLKPLLKLLTRSMPFVVEKSSTMMAKLVGAPVPHDCPAAIVAILDGHLSKFAEWAVSSLREVSAALRRAALVGLSVVWVGGWMEGRRRGPGHVCRRAGVSSLSLSLYCTLSLSLCGWA